MAWILVRSIPAAAALAMATLLLPSEARAQPSDLEHCVLNDGRPMPPNLCNMLRKMAEQGAQEFAAREKEGADAAARNEARRLGEERQKQEADAAAKKALDDAKSNAKQRLLHPSPPEPKIVHDWRAVEASNGAVYRVDIGSVRRFSTGAGGAQSAMVLMYPDEGSSRDIQAQRIYVFDCKGHVQDINSLTPPTYIPPRSVAASVAALVCARNPSIPTFKSDVSPPTGRTPAEYCVGFSADACERMKSVIESKKPPAVCRPGFGIVGSGLTPEEVRICSLMDW